MNMRDRCAYKTDLAGAAERERLGIGATYGWLVGRQECRPSETSNLSTKSDVLCFEELAWLWLNAGLGQGVAGVNDEIGMINEHLEIEGIVVGGDDHRVIFWNRG